jgi:hypothetical protein
VIDRTDIAEFNKLYKGTIDPPKKSQTKLPRRQVRHQVAAHRASAPVRAVVTSPVKAADRPRILGIHALPQDHIPHGRES